MDPAALSGPGMDPALAAGLITLGIAIIKLIDRGLDWALKKIGKGEKSSAVLQLDKETSRMLAEAHQNLRDVHSVVGRVDADGAPMVYSSRTSLEMLRDIAAVIQDVAHTQERLAASLDRLDKKFEEHDRADSRTFHVIKTSIDGIVDRMDSHEERAKRIEKNLEKKD